MNCVSRAAYDPTAIVKTRLITRATEAADLARPAGRRAVEALFERLGSALERGDRVALRRFGVFHAAPRKTEKARNPCTGEPVGIPRGRVVRFRPRRICATSPAPLEGSAARWGAGQMAFHWQPIRSMGW